MMQTQKFDELISYFNRKVAEMSIDTKHKMELLGMVTALGFAHERELTAQPEQHLDEWCTNCKEYDKEKHSCPRWNKVIKNTVDELKSTQPEQCWIPVKERNPIEYDNPIEFMATLEDPSGERYVEFVEWDGYEWDDFYTDDNERCVWGHDRVIAWMRKPEPFNGD